MSAKYHISPISRRSLSLHDDAWKNVRAAALDKANFSPDTVCPETNVRVVSSDKGFTLRFDCAEQNPHAQYHGLNDPSWLDSCVEWFLAPDNDDANYINFEQSAGGALLIGKGTSRHNRALLGDTIEEFEIEREIREDGWSVKLFIPFAFLRKYFNKIDRTFKGNFQFCNEDKGMYLTWNTINVPAPDYHRPEFFADFETEL